MAGEDSPNTVRAATDQSKALEREDCVLRARKLIAASGRGTERSVHEGREHDLVGTNEENNDLTHG